MTYRPLSAGDMDRGSVIGERIPDLELYILDTNKEPVPLGVPGEMYVGGAGLARGYLNREELTAQRFIQHPFSDDPQARLYRTGDLARFIPGYDVDYLGRIDLQVKIRGFRIELGEIENVLNQHPQVREAVVLAREDQPGDKRLAGYIVSNGTPPSIEELRQTLKLKVPDYMVPSGFVYLAEFPLTPNGKLDRKALTAPESDRPDLDSLYVAPTSEAEQVIARIWMEVLCGEQVGVDYNFFELGGDSILSIQIISKCRKAGYALSPKHLFDYQTVAELAHAAQTLDASVATVASALPTGPFSLTPIQSWFFEKDFEGADHWNQAFLFDVSESLDTDRLREALRELCEHHDALRLTFERPGEQFYGQAPSANLLSTADLDISKGELVRAVYSEEQRQLLLVIHHLAVDGVSWRILIEDLEALLRGQSLPTKTSSFADWQKALTKYTPVSEFWKNQVIRPTTIPQDSSSRGINTEESGGTLTVQLTETETQDLLTKVPAIHGTQVNDVLLAALSVALKQNQLCFDLEGHGREDLGGDPLDLSRTVGWFTSIYPVVLDLPEKASLVERLTLVKEQLAAIPNHGIDYSILRYLRPGTLPEQEERKLVFNYLGRMDQMTRDLKLFKVSSDSTGPWHSSKAKRTHELEVNAMVIHDRLQISWTFSRHLHQESTIQEIADRYAEALRELIGKKAVNVQRFALSPMQELFYNIGSTRPNYQFDQWHCHLRGPLDTERFKSAWNTVINRHSILRSTFDSDRQTVHAEVAPVWQEVTTSDTNVLLVQDKLVSNDLSTPSLSRFTLARISPEEHFFIWSLPDLQMDGWSWPIVFAEVSEVYRGGSLEAAHPYHDYLRWLEAQDQSGTEAFWKKTLVGFKHVTPIPTDVVHRKAYRSVSEAHAKLDGALTSVARRLRTTPGALIQAAWGILL
ncbi:MAG: condensation domain-containing protein, partial [Verrucomicrobiales bacterium]